MKYTLVFLAWIGAAASQPGLTPTLNKRISNLTLENCTRRRDQEIAALKDAHPLIIDTMCEPEQRQDGGSAPVSLLRNKNGAQP